MKAHVLLTGARGYVGAALLAELRRAGVRVTGVVRGRVLPGEQLERCDLLDPSELRELRRRIARLTCIVHAAGGRSSRPGATGVGHTSSAADDAAMVRNLLEAFGPDDPRFVLLSSVSVYGDWGRTRRVALGQDPRPETEYARAKVAAEEALQQGSLSNWSILRVGPVYSEKSLGNLAVRVRLPFLGLPLGIRPEPLHSLVRLDSLVRSVVSTVVQEEPGRLIGHVIDEPPLGQTQAATLLGLPFSLTVPRFVLEPVALLLRLFPGDIGALLRAFFWKFTRGVTYEPGTVTWAPNRESAPP